MLSSLSSPLRLSVVPGSHRLLRGAAVAQHARLLSTTMTTTTTTSSSWTSSFITTPCISSRNTVTQRNTGQQLRPTIQALSSSSFPSLSGSSGRYFTSSSSSSSSTTTKTTTSTTDWEASVSLAKAIMGAGRYVCTL